MSNAKVLIQGEALYSKSLHQQQPFTFSCYTYQAVEKKWKESEKVIRFAIRRIRLWPSL